MIADRALTHVGSLQWGSGNATYCEQFVEEMCGVGWQGASAQDAWTSHPTEQHKDYLYQRGDAIHFGPHPENEGYGHVGIVVAPDLFTSITSYGCKVYHISQWIAPFEGWIRYWK